jgi:hypothetical protein
MLLGSLAYERFTGGPLASDFLDAVAVPVTRSLQYSDSLLQAFLPSHSLNIRQTCLKHSSYKVHK